MFLCFSDSDSDLSGNCRRSLRSVVKLHSLTLDTNSTVKSNTKGLPANHSSPGGNQIPEEGSKMLLQQKESLEVINQIRATTWKRKH